MTKEEFNKLSVEEQAEHLAERNFPKAEYPLMHEDAKIQYLDTLKMGSRLKEKRNEQA